MKPQGCGGETAEGPGGEGEAEVAWGPGGLDGAIGSETAGGMAGRLTGEATWGIGAADGSAEGVTEGLGVPTAPPWLGRVQDAAGPATQ